MCKVNHITFCNFQTGPGAAGELINSDSLVCWMHTVHMMLKSEQRQYSSPHSAFACLHFGPHTVLHNRYDMTKFVEKAANVQREQPSENLQNYCSRAL